MTRALAGRLQGLQWRLEVFKTPNRGWGVRSWDTIPTGAYVTTYNGEPICPGTVVCWETRISSNLSSMLAAYFPTCTANGNPSASAWRPP